MGSVCSYFNSEERKSGQEVQIGMLMEQETYRLYFYAYVYDITQLMSGVVLISKVIMELHPVMGFIGIVMGPYLANRFGKKKVYPTCHNMTAFMLLNPLGWTFDIMDISTFMILMIKKENSAQRIRCDWRRMIGLGPGQMGKLESYYVLTIPLRYSIKNVWSSGKSEEKQPSIH